MRIGDQDRTFTSRAARRAKACALVVGACILLAGSAAFVLYRAQGVSSVKISPPVYAVPPVSPPLPAAGDKFFDPTFGTEIMRVTDAHTAGGANGDSSYSYWPTFNKDSTRLIIRLPTIGQARFAEFSASSFTVSNLITPASSPDGEQPDWGEALWSGTNKDKLIVHNVLGHRFFLYTVATNSYKVLANLATTLGAREYIYQVSRSIDDDRLAFTVRRDDSAIDGTYPTVGFAVWRVSTAALLYRLNTTDLNEVQIDKSGRYVLWTTDQNAGTVGANVFKVVDLDARPVTVTALTVGAPDYAMNHYAVGTGKFICGPNGYSGPSYLGLSVRALSAPHTYSTIVQFSPAYFNSVGGSAGHISWENDDESWFEVEHYSTPGGKWYPFRDEITLVEAKAGGRVRQLLHHHSVIADYYDQPRANISRDGRFVAFTSNWGGHRRDLFIARIEPESLLMPHVRPRRVRLE
jgi:hypothetical protein